MPADVGLFEVRSHADCLSVELVGLLEAGLVGPDQIGQVYVNVQVIGGHAGRVLLPRDNLMDRQRRHRVSKMIYLYMIIYMMVNGSGDVSFRSINPSLSRTSDSWKDTRSFNGHGAQTFVL